MIKVKDNALRLCLCFAMVLFFILGTNRITAAAADTEAAVIDYFTHVISDRSIDCYIHAYDPGEEASGIQSVIVWAWNTNIGDYTTGYKNEATEGTYEIDGKTYNYKYTIKMEDYENYWTGYSADVRVFDNSGNYSDVWDETGSVRNMFRDIKIDQTYAVVDSWTVVADEDGFDIYMNGHDPEPNASGIKNIRYCVWNTNIGTWESGYWKESTKGTYNVNNKNYEYYVRINKADFENYVTNYYLDAYAIDNTGAFPFATQKTVMWNKSGKNKVTLDLNKPTGAKKEPVSNVNKKIYDMKSKYTDLPTATLTGYTFLGWYTEQEDGTLVTSDTVVSNNKDHTLYAHWEPSPPSILQKPVDQNIIAYSNMTKDEYVLKHIEGTLKHDYAEGSISVKLKPEENNDYSLTDWVWKISKDDGVSWKVLVSDDSRTVTEAEAAYNTELVQADDGIYIKLNISNVKRNQNNGNISSIDGYKYKVVVKNAVGSLEAKSVKANVYWLPKIG